MSGGLKLGLVLLGAVSSPPLPMKRLTPGELCVTHGSIAHAPSGGFSISDAEVRAVSTVGRSRAAELRFTYLGRTRETRPLASGQVRLQAGLKLRAQNGCNLVYVMWRFEPKNQLVVSVKSNPGKATHAECGAQGYHNIAPARSRPPPVIRPGESHRLRASLAGESDALIVFIDDVLVWEGFLGPTALAFDGPIGLRTDTVRLDGELWQAEVEPGTKLPASQLGCTGGVDEAGD